MKVVKVDTCEGRLRDFHAGRMFDRGSGLQPGSKAIRPDNIMTQIGLLRNSINGIWGQILEKDGKIVNVICIFEQLLYANTNDTN